MVSMEAIIGAFGHVHGIFKDFYYSTFIYLYSIYETFTPVFISLKHLKILEYGSEKHETISSKPQES